MRLSASGLALCVALLPLVACQRANRPAGSDVQHAGGNLATDGSSLNWYAISDADFISTINRGAEQALPADHPMAALLNAWVKKLHARALAKYPDKFGGIPEPRVMVVVYENAWKDVKAGNYPVEAFIDTLRDAYNGSCYRAYTVDQEVKAHRYAGPWVDLGEGSNWTAALAAFKVWLSGKQRAEQSARW